MNNPRLKVAAAQLAIAIFLSSMSVLGLSPTRSLKAACRNSSNCEAFQWASCVPSGIRHR